MKNEIQHHLSFYLLTREGPHYTFFFLPFLILSVIPFPFVRSFLHSSWGCVCRSVIKRASGVSLFKRSLVVLAPVISGLVWFDSSGSPVEEGVPT
ncbi:hypothetical protein F5I97DRAFT_43726 [Phlebopus sp. FC_14]|nr:hypothetical protein F5I97DRAFT_43726 [Phlebopus sp. FC_14]